MYAFVAAWILVSTIWTAFCILDGFRLWIEFRAWRAIVAECRRESSLLLSLLMKEIDNARERMNARSGPRDVRPDASKSEPQDSRRGDADGDPSW